jgi:hypothetical protein
MDPFRDGLMYENAMWQVISGAGGAELDDWDKVNANTTDWKIRRIQSFLLVKIYQHGIKVLVFRSNNMDFSEPPIPEDGPGQNPDLTIWIPKEKMAAD